MCTPVYTIYIFSGIGAKDNLQHGRWGKKRLQSNCCEIMPSKQKRTSKVRICYLKYLVFLMKMLRIINWEVLNKCKFKPVHYLTDSLLTTTLLTHTTNSRSSVGQLSADRWLKTLWPNSWPTVGRQWVNWLLTVSWQSAEERCSSQLYFLSYKKGICHLHVLIWRALDPSNNNI